MSKEETRFGLRWKVLIVVGLLLNIGMLWFHPATAWYGDIGASSVSNFEWDQQEGRVPAVVRLNMSQYYLVAFSGETGTERHGYLRTIKVWDNNGSIQQSSVSSYEFCPKSFTPSSVEYVGHPTMVQIPGTDKYAVAYQDRMTNKKVVVSTFQVWDTNGTIKPSIIDTEAMMYNGTFATIVRVAGNVYAVSYSNSADNDGWMDTITINNDGTIDDAILSTREFDTSNAYWMTMYMIDSDTVAIAYQWSGSDGNICCWNITSGGVIGATQASNWEFDTADSMATIGMKYVSGNVYMLFYTTTSTKGKVGTLTILPTGMITGSWIDTYTDAVGKMSYVHCFVVNSGSVYGLVYHDGVASTNISTINISTTGVVGDSVIEELKMDGVADTGGFVLYVANNYYLMIYTGPGSDGWSRTASITTNYASPNFSGASPSNASTGIVLTPSCAITVNDLNGDTMTVNFYENSTGSWVLRQTNSSGNGTCRWHDTYASVHGTMYWWKVHANDGLHNVSVIYHFTTHTNGGPVFINENPVNNSVGVPIATALWNVTINDPNGDAMKWTIKTSPDVGDSSGTDYNGSRNTTLTGLAYSTVYTVFVNATDSLVDTKEWFVFTTEDNIPVVPPNVSNPSPANGSVGVPFPVTTCVDINYSFGVISEERYEWYVPGPMSASYFGDHFWNAQNFTVGAVGTNEDFVVTNITLELVRITGKTLGDVVVSIRSDISGPDLCSGMIDGDLLIDDSTPPMLERINITMSPSVVLSANTNYFIITRAPDADDSSSGAWYYIYDTGAYPGGWFFTSNDEGVSWSDDTYNTSDHWFQVWGYTETDCLHYEFWTNESGSWLEYGNGTACSNGTYCANNSFDGEFTEYWWSINVSYSAGWINTTFNFTTLLLPEFVILSNETPTDGSTFVYTFPGYYSSATTFTMSYQVNATSGLPIGMTVWFNGSFLFNIIDNNATITFDLFDFWVGNLTDGTLYNWTVNASDGSVYDNYTYSFTFTVSDCGGVLGGPALVFVQMDLSKLLFVAVLGSIMLMLVLSRRRKNVT